MNIFLSEVFKFTRNKLEGSGAGKILLVGFDLLWFGLFCFLNYAWIMK